MFDWLKKLFSKLLMPIARKAVNSAENCFGANKGSYKKRYAVNYILARLAIPYSMKIEPGHLLEELVGIAVEDACVGLEKEDKNIC